MTPVTGKASGDARDHGSSPAKLRGESDALKTRQDESVAAPRCATGLQIRL
jgi:hypothetical protein